MRKLREINLHICRGFTPSKPDIKTETLLKMNTTAEETLKALNSISNTFKELSDNSLQTQKTLDELKDILSENQLNFLNTQDEKVNELLRTVTETIKKVRQESELSKP